MYEDWLIHKTLGPIDTPVLVIDADSSKEEMIKSYESYKSKIFGTSKISLPVHHATFRIGIEKRHGCMKYAIQHSTV